MGNYTSHGSNHLSWYNRNPYSQLRCYKLSPSLPISHWKHPCDGFLAVVEVDVDLLTDTFFYCYGKKCPIEIQRRAKCEFLPKPSMNALMDPRNVIQFMDMVVSPY